MTEQEKWIAICPTGIVTEETIASAQVLMAAQRAGKSADDETKPVVTPGNEGAPGDGTGGAGDEGDGTKVPD